MANWITDGSYGFTINENVITHVDNEGVNNVFNAMWRDGDGVSSGKHYWKIYFPTLDGDAAVGLTSREHFRVGFYCKAIEYMGNLSDGSSVLANGFGPSPKQGDTIGILAVFDGFRLKMYVDVNGKSYGLAFNVPALTFKSVYPMVAFHKSGSAICTKQTEIADITKREMAALNGIVGNWKLTKFLENDVEVDLIRPTKIIIKEIDPDKYSLCIGVVNRLYVELSKVDGKWKTSFACSTRKIGHPESMTYESKVTSLFRAIKIVETCGSGILSVKSDTMSSIWVPYDSGPGPFVGEPFSRYPY